MNIFLLLHLICGFSPCRQITQIKIIVQKYDELLGGRVLLKMVEKNDVNILHAYLKTFYNTINGLCTDKVLTISSVLFLMDNISSEGAYSQDNLGCLKRGAEDIATKA